MCLYLRVMFISAQFKLEFENKHLPARQAGLAFAGEVFYERLLSLEVCYN